MGYTKYEKARIIGARALQISMGAPFMIKLDESDLVNIGYSPVELAKKEFDKGVIPITVKRLFPIEMKKSPAEERNILKDIYLGDEESLDEEGTGVSEKDEEYSEEMAVDEEDDTV